VAELQRLPSNISRALLLVLKIIRPSDGVLIASLSLLDILGGNKPFEVDITFKMAEESAVIVVSSAMITPCAIRVEKAEIMVKISIVQIIFFIVYNFSLL